MALPAEELLVNMHQTVIVLLADSVARWGMGSPRKSTVIAVISLVLTLVAYDLCVRLCRPVRFLFGMKPRRR